MFDVPSQKRGSRSALVVSLKPDALGFIAPGSAVVCAADAEGKPLVNSQGLINLFFEGNLYKAVNMEHFADKVLVAASRMDKAPGATSAQRFSKPEEIATILGKFDLDRLVFEEVFDRPALSAWAGQDADKICPVRVETPNSNFAEIEPLLAEARPVGSSQSAGTLLFLARNGQIVVHDMMKAQTTLYSKDDIELLGIASRLHLSSEDRMRILGTRVNPAADAPLLVVVHPGSMYGSARAQIGYAEASTHQLAVLETMEAHTGPMIVIDGFLSDEIPIEHNERMQLALARSMHEGYIAARIWGCDAGEKPFEAWKGFSPVSTDPIHDSQEQAIRSMIPHIGDRPVLVTGAWASFGNDGCVNSVVDELRRWMGPEASIAIDDSAIYLPEDNDTPEP